MYALPVLIAQSITQPRGTTLVYAKADGRKRFEYHSGKTTIFLLQLKTVMERCEKIPAETFESRNRTTVEEESRLWPRVDREGKALGDAEYVVPSPPEREQQTAQTLSHADLEAYVRSYQDPQVSQVTLNLGRSTCSLTNGLM